MTPAILRAALNARYVLMVRGQYRYTAREAMFERCISELTTALQEHSDTLPDKPKLRELERLDRNTGSYMDTVEWSSQ